MSEDSNVLRLEFAELPLFSNWLLQHIDDYTRVLLQLFYEVDLPLLKAFIHLSEEEKFAYSKGLNIEFLTNISQNNASGHIETVTNRWLAGQLQNIGRLDVDAKDVTLINYVRSKAQKKFINQYTSDAGKAYRLHSEIDDLSFAYNARSINDYLQVLKKRIEEEAHFSRNIIEASPGITFIYDLAKQREVYINGRVMEVTGHTPEEVLATKDLITGLTHPEDVPVVINFIQTILGEKDGRTHNADYRFKRKKGGYQWMRCYAVVYKRNQNGEPLQILGTAYDVSKEKQTALDLERSNEQLQQFASVASHDLKEPLRKIGMFSNIIITSDWDELPERTKNNLQKISDAATRMQKLIEGVLDYSSINTVLQKEKVSLDWLLQEAISNLDYKIKETGAVVTTDGLPEAEVIPLQIQQLFQNLLANAIKFSKKTSKPQIGLTHTILPAGQLKESQLMQAREYIKIDVTDNGIGFSNEVAEKIFGLFQRLHGRSDYEGAGIGLAICKRIVENHGGTISASSEVKTGSTFTLVLPYKVD